MVSNCPLCKGEAGNAIQWRDGYRICWCQACDLLFSDPMPSDEQLQAFYQGFLYREPDPAAVGKLISAKKVELSKLFDWDASSQNGKSLLDFGGGTGVTYCAATDLGLDVYFYEIDEKAIQFVQQSFGLPSERSFRRLEELNGMKFDFIIADNVIEHDKQPVEFIQRLYHLLSPGGVAVVKTPHARNTELWFYPQVSVGKKNGYAARAWHYNSWREAVGTYFFRRWNCDPPRHLYSFTAKSLRRASELAGTGSVEIDYYNLPLMEYSVTKRFYRRVNSARAAISRVLLLPLLPLEWISKLAQVALRELRLISPGGIILKLHKRNLS